MKHEEYIKKIEEILYDQEHTSIKGKMCKECKRNRIKVDQLYQLHLEGVREIEKKERTGMFQKIATLVHANGGSLTISELDQVKMPLNWADYELYSYTKPETGDYVIELKQREKLKK